MTEWEILSNVFGNNIRSHPAMMAEPLLREHLMNLRYGYLAQPRTQFGQRAFLYISSTADKKIIASWYYTQNPEMENERFGFHKQSSIYYVGHRNRATNINPRNTNHSPDSNRLSEQQEEQNRDTDKEVNYEKKFESTIKEKDKISIFHTSTKVKDPQTTILDVIVRPNDFEIHVVDAILVENDILVNHDVNVRRERIREFIFSFASEMQMMKTKLAQSETMKVSHRHTNRFRHNTKDQDKNNDDDINARKMKRERSCSRSRSPKKSSRKPSNRSRSRSYSRSRSRLNSRSKSPSVHKSYSSCSTLQPLTSHFSSSSTVTAPKRKFWDCEDEWMPLMCASNYRQVKLEIGQWELHVVPFFGPWDIEKLPFSKCFPECNTWIFYKLCVNYGRENTIDAACYKWKDFKCEIRCNFLISKRGDDDKLDYIYGMDKLYAKQYTSKTKGIYILKVKVGGRFGSQARFMNFAYSNLSESARSQFNYKHAPSNIGQFIFNQKSQLWEFVKFIDGKEPQASNVVDIVRIINQANYLTLHDIVHVVDR